ncbi:MAG: TIGR00341 family protein [Xanthomonadaceae bacterium]|nr:TIGR00341 family protein [Xanthomonadaceae bacterium]MDP2184089.1 TIGR00341 family protein [Xanthomonadales bacterium]MDZ4114394.1 TIGR00341 family protein [Xanthomonadaceae bacterium]MDZ4377270.1 TIGR00341 family protein [Xanthomonadaceae bacterium]
MPQRMIEIVFAAAHRPKIEAVVAEATPRMVWTVATDGKRFNMRALINGTHVPALLEALEPLCNGDDAPQVVVYNVEAALPLAEEDEDSAADGDGDRGEGVSRIELVDRLAEESQLTPVYAWMVALSSVVAAVGLVRGNIAVIVGAMVIAPLLVPNMTLALAATLADVRLGLKAIRTGAIGVMIAVALGMLAGWALDVDPSAPEIAGRTTVGMLDLALALAAGAAGALAMTSGVSAALVGVMVAVALLPPLIASALLAGAGHWQPALGALLLYAANVASVNLAGIVVFLGRGLTPQRWWEKRRAQRAAWAGMGFWVLTLAIVVGAIVVHNGR